MRWSDIQFDPDRKTLRQFAAIWLAFFSGLAIWQGIWRGYAPAGYVLAAVALAVGLPGLLMPAKIRPVFVAATVLAFPIGWLVSHTILAVLFYGILTPVGIVFRLMGRDPLCRRRAAVAPASYWTTKRKPDSTREYFNQF
jgi:hypothetical protein